jgi:hypothetical protein
MYLPGIEPGTICVLGRCDNRYTIGTYYQRPIRLEVVAKAFADPDNSRRSAKRPAARAVIKMCSRQTVKAANAPFELQARV